MGGTVSNFYSTVATGLSYDSVVGFTDGHNDFLFIRGEAGVGNHDSFVELVGIHLTSLGTVAGIGVVLVA